ncbi:MAG: response regulator [Spirochaetia bacterium]
MSKILIVEDENIVALDIKRQLQKNKYEILGMFASGEDALEYLKTGEKPDLVLMDIQLQGDLDGIDTASIIKKNFHIPVVMLTAFADDKTISRSKETEPFGYIIKPFEERELRTVIEMSLYRSKMQQQLQQREELFSTTLESIDDGVIITDLEGVIRYVNPVAVRMLSKSYSDYHGMQFKDVIQFTKTEDYKDSEINWIQDSEERQIPLEMRVSVLRNQKSEKTGYVYAFHDVSERLRSDRALRKSEERYRKLFEDDLSGDFIASTDSEIIDCNIAFLRMFGFDSKQEANTNNLGDLFPDQQKYQEFMEKLLEQKKLEIYELELITKNRKKIHVLANVVTEYNEEGEFSGIKGYLVDTTERVQLEEQLRQSQKMEAIGRLAGGIAHDFNNLLTVILGYSKLLLEPGVGEQSHDDIEGIQSAAKKAAALTRQLLAFSRHQIMKSKPVDLNTLISNMQKMVRRLIPETIDMRFVLEADNSIVKVDPGQIEQVIINLVLNARDAMENGGSLLLSTENIELKSEDHSVSGKIPPGEYVVFEIRDTGSGMAPETKEKLFEPFYTTKAEGEGTGLGLASVYGIIRQTNGYIQLSSELGEGTSFRIILPLTTEKEEDSKNIVKQAEHWKNRNERILLVEDDDSVRNLVFKILNREGFSIMEARNGGEAILICEEKNKHIDLLISDVVMPHMNGKKLAERLQKTLPNLKILLMSGYPDKVGIDETELNDNVAFMQKPFDSDDFLSTVNTLLDED